MKYEVKYPFLAFLISYRGMQKSKIAKALGITVNSFNNKLSGFTVFTWDEVCKMHTRFFPDIDKDQLMMQGYRFPSPYAALYKKEQRSNPNATVQPHAQGTNV